MRWPRARPAPQARLDIQNALATALGNAKQALYALYQPVAGPGGTSGFSASLVSAAQTVASAIAADSNYCASVAQPGTTVNTAVHNFKAAWNASQTPAVPINTGNYEAATATAIQQIFGSAPVPCAGGAPASAPAAPAARPHAALPVAATAAAKPGLSTGAVVGIGLLAAGAVGGIAYVATRRQRAQYRNARP